MVLSLQRLRRGVPIVNKDGMPTEAFARLWDETMSRIESVVNDQAALLAAVAAAQAAADTAQTAADSAQTAADNAQSAVDGVAAVAEDLSLQNSFPSGVSLSAADAGTDVTITISAHTRNYGDGTSVAVSAGTVTGLPYSATRFIYYDDAARTGGAVTYLASTSEIVQAGIRHSVGGVITPAAGLPPNDGVIVRFPGYVDV